MKADSYYAVNPGIKFRNEDFGGIVYQRNTDTLLYLKPRLALDLLFLAGTGSVNEIAEKIGGESLEKQKVVDQMLKILVRLREMGLVYELKN